MKLTQMLDYAMTHSVVETRNAWQEYQTLCLQCDGLKSKLDRVRENLTRMAGPSADLATMRGCFKEKLVSVPLSDAEYAGIRIDAVSCACDNFFPQGQELRCPNHMCEYYKQNHEYYDARIAYQRAVERKNNFWAPVRSRTR